jgi:hypothetical protein
MVPRVGLFATVRNRRGLTTSVEPFDGPTGRLHLVQIEYKDDQFPRDERLIWELEPASRLLEPTALPNVASSDPMPADDFDALLRATRWSVRAHSSACRLRARSTVRSRSMTFSWCHC